jgi:pimeloyl-ACP methyl ester carboxylesterase
MKNLTLLISLLFTVVSSFGQNKFTGIWQGKLSAGRDLRLVFHIKNDNGKLSATMDSPDQGATGIPCSDVITKDDSLIITLDKFKSSYAGKLNPNNTISGRWMQNGVSFMLNLKKVDKVDAPARPQSPVPPFAYKSEDLIYHSKDKSIQYGATITIPEGKGPFPAVIMSTGSGQQNRDEEIMGHKPFAVIADYLTRKGYIVLRVDDRGVGQTTGDVLQATTADFATDVKVGIDYLKSRPEVDKMKIGIIGHSEGGLIAEMVASQSKDVAFIVLLGAPGIPAIQLMEEQNAALYRKLGAEPEAIAAYLPLYNDMAEVVINSKDRAEAGKMINNLVTAWRAKTSKEIVYSTTGITDDKSQADFVKEFADLSAIPWWKYFMAADPTEYLTKLSCKVLALNGSEDIQIVSQSNLAGIRESLAKSKSVKYDVMELPGLNHLFQKCRVCAPAEYGMLEETFSPDALAVIGTWLDTHIK